MNTKNLPLKFAFLALMVALSLWLGYDKGIRYGRDLAGGHSLVFEFYTDDAKIEQLNTQKADLEKELAKAPQVKVRDLKASIKQIDSEISGLKENRIPSAQLMQGIIRVFKERIDPNGLKGLEWTPRGANRFEVSMPAGSEETRNAKAEYRLKLKNLDELNIRRSQLRKLEQSTSAEALTKEISKLSHDNEQVQQLLRAFVVAAKKAKSGAQGDLLQQENAERAVLATNVRIKSFERILESYVSISDRKKLKRQPDALKAAERQLKDYHKRIRLLEEKYSKDAYDKWVAQRTADLSADTKPTLINLITFEANKAITLFIDDVSRRELVKEVAKAYEDWANARKTLEDPSDLIRLMSKAGVLEFRIAPRAPTTDFAGDMPLTQIKKYEQILIDTIDKEGPQALQAGGDDFMWFPVRDEEDGMPSLVQMQYKGHYYVLLCNTSEETMLRKGGVPWNLSRAYDTADSNNYPAVGFTMDAAGSMRMGVITGNNVGKPMAILLDNQVYSAPSINTAIQGQGIIKLGEINQEEVSRLVRMLNAGSLPARLNPKPVAESTYGPTFGQANAESGKWAAVYGLIAVAVFMLVYYLAAGLLANAALMLNIVFLLGAMSLFEAAMTLPGIAGIVLTIGMAVDANVLIFERLREEQRRGSPVRQALKSAYERAFSAILDANVTTLITCAILAWIGTEEIRGFAITLTFGVVFSMFTSLVFTRWVFQVLLDWNIIKKPVFMFSIIGTPKINWMSKRHFFWGLSTIMVVMGMISLFIEGKDILGIELSSGTKATMVMQDDALIDGELSTADIVYDAVLHKVIEGEDVDAEKYAKLRETARVEELIDETRIDKFLKIYDTNGDKKVEFADWTKRGKNPAFFKKLDANNDGTITEAELAKLPAKAYQITTTETDLKLIRDRAAAVFPNSLERRVASRGTKVTSGKIPELGGLSVKSEGYGVIKSVTRAVYADELEDYVRGVFVVYKDITPALTLVDLSSRISDVQQGEAMSGIEIKVLPLGKSVNGKYSSFVAIGKSEDIEGTPTPAQKASLGQQLNEVTVAALASDQAMVAVNFDAAIATEATQRAIMALILSWVAIILYVWIRFGSLRWGLAAVICLVHDVIIVVGLVAASNWIADTAIGKALMIGSFKIDLPMIGAMLTVIGYSVNDTIVVFDRIRENRGKLATVSVHALNSSINQTLGRTLLTSTTTLIVLVIMYIWGGAAIRAFSFALLAGVLVGTYSSIAIASPLLMGLRKALAGKTTGVAAEEETPGS